MSPDQNPFAALGLPARPDLTDEQVRAAWRAIAAATHPDRADGGDVARYTAASAAYAELRTGWARSEAYADLTERTGVGGRDPDTAPIPVIVVLDAAPPPWQPLLALAQVPARIWRGRPLRLLTRAAAAAALSLLVLHTIPGSPAAPADVAGLALWFVLTARSDLAPRPNGRAAGGAGTPRCSRSVPGLPAVLRSGGRGRLRPARTWPPDAGTGGRQRRQAGGRPRSAAR